MKRSFWVTCGLVAVLVLKLGSFAFAQEEKSNLKSLKQEIEVLESVLNQSLAQAFPGAYSHLAQARGAYLPGYGVVFTYEINLTPMQNLRLFSSAPTPEQQRAQLQEENRRREEAKAVAERVLADFGHTLTSLPPTEAVAVIIYTNAARDTGIERSTIVVNAGKQLISEYRSNVINRAEFLRRLTKTEY